MLTHAEALWAQTHGTHVHGTAVLQAAIDGPMLRLRLQSPLENLVGFEHAPRTEQEREAVREMAESLRAPDQHFSPTPAARCAPIASNLDSPLLEAAAASGKDVGKAAPADSKPRSAHARDAHGQAHAELLAEYTFRCEQPDKLQSVEVRLFDRFRRLQRLDVQLVSPRGQRAYRLTSRQRLLAW